MLKENLQLGSSGDDVRILQEKLKILGFYNPIITGDFGLATEVGVKAFQKEYGLLETGVVDDNMWELLFEYTEPATYNTLSDYPILGLGSSGSYVRDLQVKLKTLLYYTGEINSYFDIETQIAVKRFQFHNKLTTTGIVDNQSWNVLNTLYGNLNECVIDSIENENSFDYVVLKGDTLYSIAKKYNITVDAIKALNDLTDNTLSVGQVLKIPIRETNISNVHTVQVGDTLYSIAKKYNTTVDAIKNLNNLTSNTLSIGQILKIPTSEETVPETTYTVQAGDTLYSIAKKYNTTVDTIKSLNNLTSNTLSIGQILKIPTSNENISTKTHIVQVGDTLYSIAKKYNTTVDTIKSLNNLTSNTLSIGQILKIPTSNENISTKTHIVQVGDTLYSIAKKYNTTVDTIKNLNNLPNNTLSIGQVLKISV